MRTSICLSSVAAVLAFMACGPDEKELGRNFSFRIYTHSDIVIFQGVPDGQASLLVAGEVVYFEDISDLVLGQARVTLSADGQDVATAECQATFPKPPVGEIGSESFDLDCSFTNADVDALCAATQVGIQVLVRSNLGDYQGPVDELGVQCFEDRRRPDVMALSAEPVPAGKVCRMNDGEEFEIQFGYADGRLLFEDEYSGANFMGRVAFFYDADGHVAESVSVDADGWWYLIRTYTYAGGVLQAVTSEHYPDAPTNCTYAFTNNGQTWTVSCTDGDKTTIWDSVAKTIVRSRDGVDLTLTYSGTLEGPTQWFSMPLTSYVNDFHPIDDVGDYSGHPIVTNYVYDANDRLIEANSSMDGMALGTFFYAYDCQ